MSVYKLLIFFQLLSYSNLLLVHTNTTKYSPVVQNLMGIVMEFTEMGYYIQN